MRRLLTVVILASCAAPSDPISREPAASLHHEEHPPGPLNSVFGWVNRAEAAMVTWPVALPPTGTSLVLVGRRR